MIEPSINPSNVFTFLTNIIIKQSQSYYNLPPFNHVRTAAASTVTGSLGTLMGVLEICHKGIHSFDALETGPPTPC